jgi:hypothetical protein
MDANGVMWVLDGYTNYNAPRPAGFLNSVVAIVHGQLSMLSCLLLTDDVCLFSKHARRSNTTGTSPPVWRVPAIPRAPPSATSKRNAFVTQGQPDPCALVRAFAVLLSVTVVVVLRQPALLVHGRRRLARLRVTRRLRAFGQPELLITRPVVLRADLALEARLHRCVVDPVVRSCC